MLEFLGDKATQRKLRLFAVACCRRLWSRLTDERSRKLVEVAERYADGAASEDELQEAVAAAVAAERAAEAAHRPTVWPAVGERRAEARPAYVRSLAGWNAAGAVSRLAEDVPDVVAAYALDGAADVLPEEPPGSAGWSATFKAARSRERKAQKALLNDVFGNPFRPTPAFDPAWLTWNNRTIPKLAQAIYDDRAFDRMLILADALEEAGCTNADILTHCRQRGEHVRGCWVVDLLLGKS
jgi:hypothetical protein